MEKFGRVLISSIYDRKTRVEVYDEEAYMKQFDIFNKNQGGLCEIVGLKEYQVKPYFDIDAKGEDFDYCTFDNICQDIKRIYNTEVFEAGREARIEEDGRGNKKLKHSKRFYLKARISYFNIPIVFKSIFDKYDCVDSSVYNINRILFAPLSNRKRDFDVPALKPINGSIFDCCASYILEDYEDLDLLVKPIEEPKSPKSVVIPIDEDIKDEDNANDNDKYLKLQKLIDKLSENRSSNFETWINVNWCLINICKKEGISSVKMNRLIHQFSKLSKSNYDEDKVDEWIEKNIDRVRDIGYGWKYIYQTCIKEDAPEYYDKLTQSYFNVKKDFEANHLKVIHPPFVVYIDDNKDNIIQPIPLCEKSYRHIQCYVKETNKKGEDVYKQKRFIERWLDDPQIRKYNKMVFKPPPLRVQTEEFNTWTDLEILKTPYKPNNNIIERFLEYTNNLFNNQEVVNYILAYFANRLQNPAERNKVCVILYGEEGDGKNRFFDIFKNIVGNKYYIELESGKQLFSAHSCVEKEKLFVCVNEARGKDNYENADILKARITTDTLLINPKGIQEFTIDNYCDYIMTTNNHNAVNIHDKSRRYLFVETTSYYSRNSDFFNTFSNDIVENKEALRIIYEYLMKFDVKSVIPSGNFQNHIPMTEIQETIMRDNRDKIELFLRDLVIRDEYVNDNEFDELKVKNSLFFTMWCNWIDANKIKNEYNSVAFGTRLGMLIKKRNLTEYIKKDTNSNTKINIFRLKQFFDNNP
jgi:hypothetical protein